MLIPGRVSRESTSHGPIAGWHSLHRLCCEATSSSCVHVQFLESSASKKSLHRGFLCLRHTPTSWKCVSPAIIACTESGVVGLSLRITASTWSHRGKRKILSGRQALPAAVGLGHFFKMYEVTQTISIANRQSPANQSPYWT